jgi:hypothetical protein
MGADGNAMTPTLVDDKQQRKRRRVQRTKALAR